MLKVDFYILPDTQASARETFACRLTEKAYNLGHKIYIRTADASGSTRLDELLWTFRDGSFLPHELAGQDPPDSPIVIGHQKAPPNQHDLLINLADDSPEDISRFARIAEIVAGDDDTRSRARERFRHYREQGVELESHQIS